MLAQQAPCILQIDSVQFLCYDHDTPLDSTDDYFVVHFQVSGGAGNDTDSFALSWPGVSDYGHYAYGSMVDLNFEANGAFFSIHAADVNDLACKDSLAVPSLIPCSAPCHFDLDTRVEIHCNNATTEQNTADDYYSISFEIPSISTKPGYLVYLDGDSIGLFPYNRLNYFNHPADSMHHTIIFMDSKDSSCFFQTILGRFIPCSRNCYITQEYLTILCNDHQTPFEIADDSLEIIAVINAYHGTDSFAVYLGPYAPTSHAYGDTLRWKMPYRVDSLLVKVEDKEKPDCIRLFYWQLPPPCSVDCSQYPFPGVQTDTLLTLTCHERCQTLTAPLFSGWQSQWVNGTNGQINKTDTLQICETGSYYLQYTHLSSSCPAAFDTIVVVADTMIAKPVIHWQLMKASICDSAIYLLTTPYNPVQQYQWAAGHISSDQLSLVVAGPVQVTLKTLNPMNGCADSVSLNLAGPITLEKWHILPYENLNCTRRFTVLSVDTTKYHSHETVQWKKSSDGNNWQTNKALEVTQAGLYNVRLGDADGGCYKDTVLEVFDLAEKIEVQLSQLGTVKCKKDSATIQILVKNENGPVTYGIQLQTMGTNWQTAGSDSTLFRVAGSGTYSVTVTRPTDGCTGSDSIVIEAKPQMAVSWSCIQPKCDEQLLGGIQLETEKPAIQQWYLNDKIQNNVFASRLEPGPYKVLAIDTLGCRHDTTVFLHQVKKLTIHAPSLIELDFGATTKVAAEINRTVDELEAYSWSPLDQVSCSQCMETWVEGKEDETLTFAARDTAGCEAAVSVDIRVRREVIITVPNIISDESADNGRFTIYGNEHVSHVTEITIYDRWGNRIWHTDTDCLNNPAAGWDGQINGRAVVNGVYTYTALVEIYNGEKRVVSGDITRFFR